MANADDVLAERKAATEERFGHVQSSLRPIEPLLGDYATVYATGSYGRGEASKHSDLDVFILTDTDEKKSPKLRGLDTIRVQAALIEAAEQAGLQPFSDEGVYLKPHTLTDMIEKLGGRDDDYENLFTARMLLLLESRPLMGQPMHERAVDLVLDEYWKDFAAHPDDFLPIYLTNDLIRYWKVLCLNYEAHARTADDPNKRRLNNYKLRHSRLLTCYSAILYFCHLLQSRRAITKEDAREMTTLTPTERLNRVGSNTPASDLVDEILAMYVEFLQSTDAPKADLLARFANRDYRSDRRHSGGEFGDRVFDLLKRIGDKTPLFRYLVV